MRSPVSRVNSPDAISTRSSSPSTTAALLPSENALTRLFGCAFVGADAFAGDELRGVDADLGDEVEAADAIAGAASAALTSATSASERDRITSAILAVPADERLRRRWR